jgi:circadian clock protein KaiB
MKNDNAEFEKALELQKTQKYVLCLYVSGLTPRSIKAIENTRTICREQLEERYELEVIDIYQQPEKAREGQIIAAPTLIRKQPLPVRRFVGDISKAELILIE